MNAGPNLVATSVNSKPVIFATSLISASAAAIFLIMPILIGVATEALILSPEQAGLIASSYFAGYLLICLSAIVWIRRFNLRKISLLGHTLLIGGVLASVSTIDYQLVLACFFLAGCGGGILFALCIHILSQTGDPDRYFGVKLTSEQALAAILLFTLPHFIIEKWGFTGLGICLGTVFLLLGVSSVYLPKTAGEFSTQESATGSASERGVWLGLFCLMIFMGGLSGVWAFIERMAVSRGLSGGEIGTALSMGVIGGGVGAFAAALFGDRFGRTIPLGLALAVLSLVLGILNGNFSTGIFILCCIALSGFWNYSLAYQMGIVALLDKTGRLSVLMSSALALGAMLGPALAGGLIRGENYLYVHILAFACMVLATGLFIYLSKRDRA